MLLADLGADVLRIERPAARPPVKIPNDPLERSRRSVVVDLKSEGGVEIVMRLVESADVLIEGFRPGVAERIGIGPEACLDRNPRLVYGRMTGWGQDGPLAQAAGHDPNYVALTGMLHSIGDNGGPPVMPLNLVGDFGGGGMFLAVGILAALVERERSGRGQVVDAAMVDGAAVLGSSFYGLHAAGQWKSDRTNSANGAAHWAGVYETADGRYVVLAALEPQFYAELLHRLGVDPDTLPPQHDEAGWPKARAIFSEIFLSKTRDEWCEILEGTDSCFAPVLDLDEAPSHPHNVARRSFVEVGGVVQPAPAPRFSRTPLADPTPPSPPGQGADDELRSWGVSDADVARLRAAGAIQ